MKTTANQLIDIGSPSPCDEDEFLTQIQLLMSASYEGKEDTVRELVLKTVPTYRP